MRRNERRADQDLDQPLWSRRKGVCLVWHLSWRSMSSTTRAVLFPVPTPSSPSPSPWQPPGLRSGQSPLTQTGEILFGEIYSWESSLAFSCHQKTLQTAPSVIEFTISYLVDCSFFCDIYLEGITQGFAWKLFSSKQKYLTIQSSLLVAGIFFACVCERDCENVFDACYLRVLFNPSKCKSSDLIALLFPNCVYVCYAQYAAKSI